MCTICREECLSVLTRVNLLSVYPFYNVIQNNWLNWMNHCLVFCLSEGKRRAKSVEQAVQRQPLPFVSPPPLAKLRFAILDLDWH